MVQESTRVSEIKHVCFLVQTNSSMSIHFDCRSSYKHECTNTIVSTVHHPAIVCGAGVHQCLVSPEDKDRLFHSHSNRTRKSTKHHFVGSLLSTWKLN